MRSSDPLLIREEIMKKIQNRPDTLYKRQVRIVSRVAMLIASLLILSFDSSKLATIGWAQGGTTVRIDPASQNVGLGGTATTDVLVENVDNLYGFELHITFDPTLVEGVQVQPGSFLSPDWEIDNTIDNANGIIDYALCQLNPSLPKSGDGILATITWRGKAVGTSPIHFTYVQLGAPGGVPIPATPQDSQITVEAVDLELTKIVDNDSPNVGEQVMFTITVSNTGSLDATGVEVKDFYRSGPLTYGSVEGVDYSASVGAYYPITVTWDIGDLAVGAWATLYLTATVTDTGYFENFAEVIACDQPDADSTPDNFSEDSFPYEDDTDWASGNGQPTAATLSSFAARSSASGLSASKLWPGLAGLTVLATGSLLLAKRWAGLQ